MAAAGFRYVLEGCPGCENRSENVTCLVHEVLAAVSRKLTSGDNDLENAQQVRPRSFGMAILASPFDGSPLLLVDDQAAVLVRPWGLPITKIETTNTPLVNPDKVTVEVNGDVTCNVAGGDRTAASWLEC